MPDRFLVALGGGVFVVWASAMGVELVTAGSYQVALPVHALMGTIVGSVFTEYRIRKKQRDRKQEEDTDG